MHKLLLFVAAVLALVGVTAAQDVGTFRVSDFAASGTHTAYDIARQAADAYASSYPATGSVLYLPAGFVQTCDSAPLPVSASGYGTTSIVGAGVGVTILQKRTGCAASAATLSHTAAIGPLSRGRYEGFTVDANHIDAAACEIYGMQQTTISQVSCGNAAGGDHEFELGNNVANNAGWADNIYGYQLSTYDTVGVGKGAILAPVWSGTSLSALTLTNAGTKAYSQFVRATLIGPGVASCTTVPTFIPTITNTLSANFPNVGVVNYGPVSGATVLTAGNCPSMAQSSIYVLIQDGLTTTYGIKMTNVADSHFWDMEPTGANYYGLYWSNHSGNNQIVGEHPYTNATVGIYDAGPGNRHTNTEMDSVGQYGFQIVSTTGSVQNPIFIWDSAVSYIGATAFYFSNSAPSYIDYQVSNSNCSSFTPNFVLAAYAGSSIPAGVHLTNTSACNGSSTNLDKYAFQRTMTREGQGIFSDQIYSTTEMQRRDINSATGTDQPWTETFVNNFLPTSQATEQASPARKWLTNCYVNGASGATQMIMQLVPQKTGAAGQALFNIAGGGNCHIAFTFGANGATITLNPAVSGNLAVDASEVVPSSATPVFSGNASYSEMVLTSNVTMWTIGNGPYAGAQKTICWVQNAAGGYAVSAAPSNLRGFTAVGTTASKSSCQVYKWSASQTAWLATAQGVANQ